MDVAVWRAHGASTLAAGWSCAKSWIDRQEGSRAVIVFNDVSGPCLLEDGIQSRRAYSGMVISHYSEKCIVATGVNGRAKLTVNGHLIELPPESYLAVRPMGSRVFRHKSNTNSFMIWCGRIWATVMDVVGRPDEKEVNPGNAVAGVRG